MASGALGTGGARPRLAAWAVAGVAIAALWFLARPYLGIVGDAQVYIGRAVADLDPGGVGRELDFARDGQSGFSLFRPAAAALTAALGPGAAAEALTALGLAAWLAAAAALFGQLARDATAGDGPRGADRPGRWAGRGALLAAALVGVAWLPSDYGWLGAYHFAEAFASARLWAEAAGLAALALAVDGERRAGLGERGGAPRLAGALGLCVVAAALHPIMAMAPIGAVWALLAWRDARWWAATPLAAVALAGAGLAGAPVAARLYQAIDPAWRAAVAMRTPPVFPLLWPATSWAWIGCQMATLALAAQALQGAARRLAIAAGALGLAGVAATLAWPSLLILQLQPWRALWLGAVLAAATLPLTGAWLWRRGGAGRAALAALALAWVLRDAAAACAACAGLALALAAWPARWRLPRLAWMGALGVAAGVAALVVALRIRTGLAVFGPITASPGEALANAWRTGAQVPLGLAAALAIAIGGPALGTRPWAGGGWRWAPGVAGGAAALLLGLAALALWDARAPFERSVEEGRARMPAGLIAPGAEVYWHGGFGAEWLVTGAPDWWGRWQGAGMLFDRTQALEWARRRRLAVAAGLAPAVYRPDEGWPAPLALGAARALCAGPGGPDVLVAAAPLVADPALVARAKPWRAPAPRLVPGPDRRGLVALGDYAVIPCAAALAAPG